MHMAVRAHHFTPLRNISQYSPRHSITRVRMEALKFVMTDIRVASKLNDFSS
jgi:hypothetical protein